MSLQAMSNAVPLLSAVGGPMVPGKLESYGGCKTMEIHRTMHGMLSLACQQGQWVLLEWLPLVSMKANRLPRCYLIPGLNSTIKMFGHYGKVKG